MSSKVKSTKTNKTVPKRYKQPDTFKICIRNISATTTLEQMLQIFTELGLKDPDDYSVLYFFSGLKVGNPVSTLYLQCTTKVIMQHTIEVINSYEPVNNMQTSFKAEISFNQQIIAYKKPKIHKLEDSEFYQQFLENEEKFSENQPECIPNETIEDSSNFINYIQDSLAKLSTSKNISNKDKQLVAFFKKQKKLQMENEDKSEKKHKKNKPSSQLQSVYHNITLSHRLLLHLWDAGRYDKLDSISVHVLTDIVNIDNQIENCIAINEKKIIETKKLQKQQVITRKQKKAELKKYKGEMRQFKRSRYRQICKLIDNNINTYENQLNTNLSNNNLSNNNNNNTISINNELPTKTISNTINNSKQKQNTGKLTNKNDSNSKPVLVSSPLLSCLPTKTIPKDLNLNQKLVSIPTNNNVLLLKKNPITTTTTSKENSSQNTNTNEITGNTINIKENEEKQKGKSVKKSTQVKAKKNTPKSITISIPIPSKTQ